MERAPDVSPNDDLGTAAPPTGIARGMTITGDLLADILVPGWSVHVRCTDGLPKGARLADAGIDRLGRLVLWWTHESFKPGDGALTATFTKSGCEAP